MFAHVFFHIDDSSIGSLRKHFCIRQKTRKELQQNTTRLNKFRIIAKPILRNHLHQRCLIVVFLWVAILKLTPLINLYKPFYQNFVQRCRINFKREREMFEKTVSAIFHRLEHMNIIETEIAIAAVGMRSKWRNDIQMTGRQNLFAMIHENTRLTFHHQIDSEKRTVDIVEIPIGMMFPITNMQWHKLRKC